MLTGNQGVSTGKHTQPLTVRYTQTLIGTTALRIEYSATTDKDTVLQNLTSILISHLRAREGRHPWAFYAYEIDAIPQ